MLSTVWSLLRIDGIGAMDPYWIDIVVSICDIFNQYFSLVEPVCSGADSITPYYKLKESSGVTFQGERARCADELISATLPTEDPGKP